VTELFSDCVVAALLASKDSADRKPSSLSRVAVILTAFMVVASLSAQSALANPTPPPTPHIIFSGISATSTASVTVPDTRFGSEAADVEVKIEACRYALIGRAKGDVSVPQLCRDAMRAVEKLFEKCHPHGLPLCTGGACVVPPCETSQPSSKDKPQ
jgi:hypothetical protein